MDKRYQVFVSSTFLDLKDERSKVIQTIMELDCIPAGMEIFPAIDEEQFNFIKRIIDDCDYYILIVGGRYGSESEDGISYTEKEYNYAVEKGIKVIAFIHSNPESIPLNKSEVDTSVREKMEAFKKKASTNRLVKPWTRAEELPGLVALSLSKTIKTYPAVGWVRANQITNVESLQELNELRKENQELKKKVQENSISINTADLAGLEDEIEILSEGYIKDVSGWKIKTTWGYVFYILSPHLLEHPNDDVVKGTLDKEFMEIARFSGYRKMEFQIFQTIKIQFEVLGLIKTKYLKTTKGGMNLFWSLTDKGKQTMYELRSVKKIKPFNFDFSIDSDISPGN